MDTMGEEDIEGDDDIEGMDVVGDDDEVGARGRRMRHALARRGSRIHLTLPRSLRGASRQGVSQPSEEMDFLPFNVIQIVFGGPTNSFAEGFPQRPFRGERLIATAVLTTAAGSIDASGLVTITPALYVGAVQVGASQGATPLAAFAAQAFGVRLRFPPAGQGTRVFIPFAYGGPALGAADTLLVSMTVIGRAVR
jgi:hypothetical protein